MDKLNNLSNEIKTLLKARLHLISQSNTFYFNGKYYKQDRNMCLNGPSISSDTINQSINKLNNVSKRIKTSSED